VALEVTLLQSRIKITDMNSVRIDMMTDESDKREMNIDE
jgi:hypothetical protein